MTKIRKHLEESEDGMEPIPDVARTNTPVGTGTRSPSPSGHPHLDDEKILKYIGSK